MDSYSPYKRMVALPETEYEQLKHCKADTSSLVWPHDTSTEREQKLYAISLRKNRKSLRETIKPLSTIGTTTSRVEKEIEHFPNSFRSRAQRLLASLTRYKPAIDWNEKAEVTFGPHGTPYLGTNLLDLIHHATAIKRRGFVPLGWTEFLGKLKEFNIASSIMNKETLHESRGENTVARRGRKRRDLTPDLSGSFIDWDSIA